jgi:hypothetical protein
MNTYELEISGDSFGCEKIESDTPIPIPNVGDTIYFPDGTEGYPDRSFTVKVVKRLFQYLPGREGTTMYVQVVCQRLETNG